MRKRELERLVESLATDVNTLGVSLEIAENAYMRALTDENEGFTLLGAGTVRNRTLQNVQDDLTNAYRAWATNPLAKSYCDYLRFFVIGKGTRIDTQDGDEAQERIDLFCKLNNWSLLEKQITEESARDGESFVRLHYQNQYGARASVAAVSLVDPLEIEAIDCQDMGEPKRYLRSFTRLGEMDDSGQQSSEQASEWIEANDIVHIALNTSHNELRGRSDLAVVLRWLAQHKRWLDDMSRRNYLIGCINWFVNVQGGLRPADITGKYTKPPTPGTVIAHGPNEEWTVSSPDMKWADSTEGARAIKLQVMAAFKHPESWYGDTGESNLATTQALAMPTLKAFIDRQDTLKGYFEEIISRGAGVENVSVTFPELVMEEANLKAQALSNLSNALMNFSTQGIVSNETAYKILQGFLDDLDDWEQDESGVGERARIEQEEEESVTRIATGKGTGGLVRPGLEETGPPIQPPNA